MDSVSGARNGGFSTLPLRMHKIGLRGEDERFYDGF
jgi:hypothetical protein